MSRSDLSDLFNDYKKGNINKSEAIRNLLVIIERNSNNELKNEALEYLIRLGSDLTVLKALERLFFNNYEDKFKIKIADYYLKSFFEEEDKKNKWYLRKNPCLDSLISIYNYYRNLDKRIFYRC